MVQNKGDTFYNTTQKQRVVHPNNVTTNVKTKKKNKAQQKKNKAQQEAD